MELLSADTSDLRALAQIAGADPTTFYRTANFRRADLSDQNLDGIMLDQSTLSKAKTPPAPNTDTLTARKVRFLIRLNPIIHDVIKYSNPRISTTIEAMLIDYMADAGIGRQYDAPRSRLETDWELRALRAIAPRAPEDWYVEAMGRKHLYSYYVDEALKDAVVGVEREQAIFSTKSDAGRRAIYEVLSRVPWRYTDRSRYVVNYEVLHKPTLLQS